jgi:hypothetical protein
MGLADPAATRAAVLLFAVQHALAKAALFLGVAPGLPRRVALALLALAALSLTGAPLTPGYAAKAASAAAAPALAGAMTLAAFGTAALMARALWLVAHLPQARPRPAQATAFLLVVGGLLLLPLTLGAAVLPKDMAGFALALAPALTALAGGVLLARLQWRWPAVPPGDLVVFAPSWDRLAPMIQPPAPQTPAPRPTGAPVDPALPDEAALWRGAGYGMAVTLAVVALAVLSG